MAAAIIGSNIRLEVQSALGSAKTISGITLANPGVATSTSHGFSNGDVVKFEITSGMAQLDGQAVRVANVTSDTFELEGINTTSYEAFSAGTATEITTFATLSKAQSVTAPNPAPQKIDITTLIDIVKQFAYGLSDAPDGTIGALFNPGGTTEAIIAAATAANTPLVFRITYSDSRKTIFNANVSGGFGFDLPTNDAAKSSIAFTPVKLMMHYAS